MRAVFESDIVVFEMGGRFSIGANGEVLHIAGVVAFGIIETMLLVLGIEVSTGRFKIRPFALGNLMEVDGVLSGREVVKFDFESDARSLIPNDHVADGFALRIFQFDFGFGRARGCEGDEREEQSEDKISNGFHGYSSLLAPRIIANPATPDSSDGPS